MKRIIRSAVAILVMGICGLIGWWLAPKSARNATPKAVATKTITTPKAAKPRSSPPRIYRNEFRDGTTVELFASGKPDEIILRFPNDESYGTFIYTLAGSQKVELVGQLDRLRAMRLRYDDWEEMATLLDDEHILTYDSLPSVPTPNSSNVGTAREMAPFGDSLLSWLGITTDNSRWGAGVRVAVIDSGIVPHPDLPGLSRSIEITPFPENLSDTNGHGTAVASLIAGNNALAPGVAPAAELISIRVGDDAGKADSFALAAGILAALDSYAQIINISMGTREDNPLIREAVQMAQEKGVVIVAATGNSAQDDACYPAAYPSVISVGAVDARGEHLEFSNYGTYLSISAPGYSLNAAWPGDRYSKISGTSASAPIVTGAIAATMSNGSGFRITASQAAEIVIANSNEAGLPGPDSEYGVGILDLGRVMNRHTPGIVDGAITDQRIVKSANPAVSDELEVTVQNRGTAVLVNTLVEVTTPFGTRQFNATTLAPGAIQTFSMPVRLTGFPAGGGFSVRSKLSIGSTGADATPHNNHREDLLPAH